MIILTIKTDQEKAEIGLYKDTLQLDYITWQAHLKLAETIHIRIEHILKNQQLNFADIEGIVVYKGPGSFTGLRIGISLANALAFSLAVPIIAVQTNNWLDDGINKILAKDNDKIVLPFYGAEPHITKPKK